MEPNPKRLKSSVQRTNHDDLRSHNDQGKKLEHPDTCALSQKHTSSKDHKKKLSFFYDVDDDTDNSSIIEISVSSKWIKDDEKINADNNNGFQRGAGSNSCAIKKSAEVVESEHDDASSTSSCSCEDHSSVAGRSDDEFHEDLDYDEDSITDSPPRASVNNKLTNNESTKSATPPTKNGEGKASTIDFNDSGSPDSNKSKPTNAPGSTRESNDNERRVKNGSQAPQTSGHIRIRSVINFDHDKDCGDQTSRTRFKEGEKSHKSYDYLLKYFFKDACYFQIKSINHENVELSKSIGVWSTQLQNEIRLNAAFREHRNIILIFSVQQSGGFQGFARMISESKLSNKTIPWILPERMSNKSLGGVFKVEWLCTKELPFHETQDLYNPFNGNKPVKVARDGQQVEPKIGKKLCRLFPHDSKKNLLSRIATLKRQVSQRKKSSQRHDNFYPLPDRRGYTDERYRQNYVPVPGLNDLGDPGLASHINQNYMNYHDPHSQNYRPIGRSRASDQPNQGIFNNRPIPYPSPYGPMRSHHMPRNVNGMPRCLMPNSYNDFHHNQGYNPPLNHQYPGSYDGWEPEMGRYHSYQGSRR